MKILVAKDIVKAYRGTNVLDGISLEVQKSEILSIVGPSGAGKSTLLHILGTLDKPDAGSLSILDKEVNKMSQFRISKFRNINIGFVFQFHNLLPEFSALENVMLPGLIASKKKKLVEEKARYLLDILHLSHRVNNKPSELSGGEQQRTAVARALINDPSIVFADEPSGNLDEKNADELHSLFFKLRDEFKQTFVIVTHNKAFANETDRKLTLQNGVISAENE